MEAIQTRYNGYRFRSRLEARWAVFFDALGLQWEYEAEGFDLGDLGWYLPDFWLAEMKYCLEIKPAAPYQKCDEDAFHKIIAIEGEGIRSFLIHGIPGPISDPYDPQNSYQVFVYGDYNYCWCQCPDCGVLGLQWEGRSGRNKNHSQDCQVTNFLECSALSRESPLITMAWKAARSARFEHGGTHP